MKHLSSRQNPLVATFRALSRGRDSDASEMLLDGPHLVADALSSGIAIRVAVVAERFLRSPQGLELLHSLTSHGAEVMSASDNVLDAISPVWTPSGIAAIARRPVAALDSAFRNAPQLVVAALNVQDPGNVGAIARAAEAGGATGVVFCGACADPFGWKALRGSMGSLFRLPAASGLGLQDVLRVARAAGTRILAAVPRGGASLFELDLRPPTTFVLGGEGPGLGEDAVALADERVSIPMRPQVESLNVAVASAILVYEAARQRAATTFNCAKRGSS